MILFYDKFSWLLICVNIKNVITLLIRLINKSMAISVLYIFIVITILTKIMIYKKLLYDVRLLLEI